MSNKYSAITDWLKGKSKENIAITIGDLEKECSITFPQTFSWSNNCKNAKNWLVQDYVVYEATNILIFEYNSSLAKAILSGTNFKKTESSVAYALFKVGEKDEFYKQMNFYPRYFESAVEHFYNAPLKSERTKNGKTIFPETRYNSWVNCYNYFSNNIKGKTTLTSKEIDDACVQLGFYMASWGMYRGSSFLLQNDYTIYRDILAKLLDPQYDILWNLDTYIDRLPNVALPLPTITKFVDDFSNKLTSLIGDIRDILAPYKDYYVRKTWYTNHSNSATIPEVSKTLVTKLILGTIGCYPAIDRYFGDAVGSVANDLEIDQIKCMLALAYCVKKDMVSSKISFKLANDGGNVALPLSDYPVMKLIDMYYFTFGMEKPFLKLINELVTGKKTITSISKDDKKLLKQFIINNSGSPKVDIAFPCSLLSKSTPATGPCIHLDICEIAKAPPSNKCELDYENIIDKLADKNLYEELSKMKDDEDPES